MNQTYMSDSFVFHFRVITDNFKCLKTMSINCWNLINRQVQHAICCNCACSLFIVYCSVGSSEVCFLYVGYYTVATINGNRRWSFQTMPLCLTSSMINPRLLFTSTVIHSSTSDSTGYSMITMNQLQWLIKIRPSISNNNLLYTQPLYHLIYKSHQVLILNIWFLVFCYNRC